ncbi:hypothetical protein [Asticcacaulis excentricus]|uniref:hypothetical protein n=1 Tax=Asticcacaulis excentricus TaxID=78587 RepID=UPI0002EF1098|nr:hypothetical protein [Asticcacaulis excentricus]
MESSTLTPMLKRQESAGCLAKALREASGQDLKALGELNDDIRHLRDKLCNGIDGWQDPA